MRLRTLLRKRIKFPKQIWQCSQTYRKVFLKKEESNQDQPSLFGIRYKPETSSWILPIRDPYSSELWGWQDKSATRRLFRFYPSGTAKSRTLFGISTFADGSTLVITESGLDSVRVNDFGAGSGVACFGLPVSNTQLSLIQSITESVVLAFDNDTPGIRETERICREFKGCNSVWVYNYGSANVKDPGEQTDEQVRWSFDNMKSSLRWLKERR